VVKPLSAKCAGHAEAWSASAERELNTAEVLRATGQDWPNVYWHAGFSVEMMLKAIRVKQDNLEEWPPSDKVKKWHNIVVLMENALLKAAVTSASSRDKTFGAYWLTVKDWEQERRYPGNLPTERDARDLLLAVTNHTSGVMRWLLQTYHSI
jgi:hypothetical protein